MPRSSVCTSLASGFTSRIRSIASTSARAGRGRAVVAPAGGVAVTLPHVDEPDWTVAAQVSRAAAVVFAGPLTAHFGLDEVPAAAELIGQALRGELTV